MSRSEFILASTHIGCAQDFPQRSLEVLRTSDLLVFEDDRFARQALKAAGIHRPFLKWSEHREPPTLDLVRESFMKGESVVYMSDQGMPNVADPGRELIALAQDLGVKLKIIPGPSSLTTALAGCPFDLTQFHYRGFLPRDREARLKELKQIAVAKTPTVILDTPYRMLSVLEDCQRTFSRGRLEFVAIDLSGPHEDYLVGNPQEVLELARAITANHKDLNFVLIVDGVRG